MITIDIETLPADWTEEQKRAAARAAVPGNYSKPDTIEKWIAENVDDVHRRTSFDWRFCRVLCIGYAIDDETPGCVYSETAAPVPLLDGLYAVINRASGGLSGPMTFVGHNLARFDLPRLRLMAIKHRHPVARLLPAEKYSRFALDTMTMAGGTDPTMTPRLAHLAEYFGIEGKGEGLDGSKVYDAWLAGEHERIAAYCCQDVALTRSIYKLLTGRYETP